LNVGVQGLHNGVEVSLQRWFIRCARFVSTGSIDRGIKPNIGYIPLSPRVSTSENKNRRKEFDKEISKNVYRTLRVKFNKKIYQFTKNKRKN